MDTPPAESKPAGGAPEGAGGLAPSGEAGAGPATWIGERNRRNLSYRDLAVKLGEIGVPDSELNIKNKISRGGFSATFVIQCLLASGRHTVRLDDVLLWRSFWLLAPQKLRTDQRGSPTIANSHKAKAPTVPALASSQPPAR